MSKVPIGPKTTVHAASVSNGRSRQPPSFLLLPFFPLLPLPLLLLFRRRVFGVSSPLLRPASSSTSDRLGTGDLRSSPMMLSPRVHAPATGTHSDATLTSAVFGGVKRATECLGQRQHVPHL